MPTPLTRLAQRVAPYSISIALGGVILCAAALILPDARLGLAAFASGGAILWAIAILREIERRRRRRIGRLHASIAEFVAHDAAPSFTTDADGVIGYENRAAKERFGGQDGQNILKALDEMFAAPAATLSRLQAKAQAHGAAREDVATRTGHMRLSVHVIGRGGFLWRLEDLSERGDGGVAAEAVALPMMILSQGDKVLYTNAALHRLVGHRERALDRIVTDLPLRNGDMHMLAGSKGPIYARTAIYESATGRREVYFLPDMAPQMGEWSQLDALPVALLKVTRDGRISECNRPARELLAMPCDYAGMALADLVEGLGRSVSDWVMDVAMGRVQKAEFVRASRPEKDTFLQIALNRVADGEGNVDLIAVLTDATQLKALEAQFVQSQKMQAIGQLAGGVAHDFNNLLTAISGHCDLLLLRHDSNDPEYGDLVQIHQNANRAAALVGQLLAFSRKQTLKPEVIDLRETLSDLTHLLNRLVGEKIALSVSHDADLRPIRVDKRQLEQVIMNLVVNARDAMSEGGEITIQTENALLSEAMVKARATIPAGDYVVVSVTDEGRGIPKDHLQQIFEPFYTTKRTGEGTGLGLSTAYGIIKQTGGFIFVDSAVGVGTKFTIYLPAHSAASAEELKNDLNKGPKRVVERGDGVVLLVEDEAPVRAFASRALRMRGYTVLEAENAEDALEMLDDPDLKIDLFLSDVIMPGMDGPTWVAKAREARPDVRVIFVSGYAEDHFPDQQARIPNSIFLQKPFSLSELTDTVAAQFEK
ncbi:ATP-binding protein [Celeribacter sp.]|uniref:hybrid sensor histidine kinase/response regulator n=1 Tax=Celeribacter sp. TaxID=1890673 RepID=UPI003A93B7FE